MIRELVKPISKRSIHFHIMFIVHDPTPSKAQQVINVAKGTLYLVEQELLKSSVSDRSIAMKELQSKFGFVIQLSPIPEISFTPDQLKTLAAGAIVPIIERGDYFYLYKKSQAVTGLFIFLQLDSQ